MADRTISFKLIGDPRGAVDAFKEVASQAEKTREKSEGAFGRISRALGSVARMTTSVVAGLGAFNALSSAFSFAKEAAIDFNAQLENSQIGFTTMLGSAQKATDFLQQLQKFAAKTPFEFGDIVRYSQSLLAMGISAKDVIPYMTAIGDAAAALGGSPEIVERLAMAIGQMSAKGRVQSEELLQMTEAGVPALRILAASYGKTTAEISKMIQNGKIASADALPRLIEGLEKGTSATAGFGGMMEKQSATFTGAMSNIHDSLMMIISTAFRPLYQALERGAQRLADFLGSERFKAWQAALSTTFSRAMTIVQRLIERFRNSDTISEFFTRIRDAAGRIVDFFTSSLIPSVTKLITTFGPPLLTAIRAVASHVTDLLGVLRPLGDVIRAVTDFVTRHKDAVLILAAAVGGAAAAFKAWQMAIMAWNVVTRIATAAQIAFNVAMNANPIMLLVMALAALTAALVVAFMHSQKFRDIIKDAFGVVKSVASDVVSFFTTAVPAAFHAVVDAAHAVWSWLKANWPLIAQIIIAIFVPGGPIIAAVWHFKDRILDVFSAAWGGIKRGIWDVKQWIVDRMVDVIRFFTGVPSRLSYAVSGMWDGLKSAFKTVINWIIGKWNALEFRIPAVHVPGIGDIGGVTIGVPDIPYLATGTTNFAGGLAVVGERGPELVSLPRGSQVIPAERTQTVLRRQQQITINVVANGADPHRLAQAVRRELAWSMR